MWCRSLCPLGGFYEALGRFGQVNVKIDPAACIHCDACKHACLSDPRSSSQRSTDATRSCGRSTAWPAVRASTPAPRALSFTLGRASKPAAPNGEE
ncbi:MAG: 4Fe-4S binding protein [Eggerthella lenta]